MNMAISTAQPKKLPCIWPRSFKRPKLAASRIETMHKQRFCITLIPSDEASAELAVCSFDPAGQARTRIQMRMAVLNGITTYKDIIAVQPIRKSTNEATAKTPIMALAISVWKIALRQPGGGIVHVQRANGKNSC